MLEMKDGKLEKMACRRPVNRKYPGVYSSSTLVDADFTDSTMTSGKQALGAELRHLRQQSFYGYDTKRYVVNCHSRLRIGQNLHLQIGTLVEFRRDCSPKPWYCSGTSSISWCKLKVRFMAQIHP